MSHTFTVPFPLSCFYSPFRYPAFPSPMTKLDWLMIMWPDNPAWHSVMTLEVHHRVSSVSTSSRFKVLFDSGFKVLFDGVVIVSDREGKIVYMSFVFTPQRVRVNPGLFKNNMSWWKIACFQVKRSRLQGKLFPLNTEILFTWTTDHFNDVYRERRSRLQGNLFSCNREI